MQNEAGINYEGLLLLPQVVGQSSKSDGEGYYHAAAFWYRLAIASTSLSEQRQPSIVTLNGSSGPSSSVRYVEEGTATPHISKTFPK